MTYSQNSSRIAAGLLSLFIIASCSSSENTTVVTDAPTSSSQTDEGSEAVATSDSFQQLSIGENQPIRTLDPLSVENAASMRAVQLIYEGLLRFNESGTPMPAIAHKYATSNNDKTYRFNLRTDLFYHDNTVFSNGTGRKLVASDVQYVFERMAKNNVPDAAAKLFMNIRGFEPYYREQQQIKYTADRQLDTISGITVSNDSTITFKLVEPDPDFLKKLASPRAVIYPKEAVNNSGFNAVGTGAFTLSQKRNDSMYILAKFENYRIDGQPSLDRIDIQTSSDDTAMLNALKRGDIQLIPQMSPTQIQMVSNKDGSLKSSFQSNLQLYPDNGILAYYLHYNTGADVSSNAVANTLSQIDQDGFFSDLRDDVKIKWSLPESSGSTVDSLRSTYSADPYVKQFYDELSYKLKQNGVAFSESTSRIANRTIPLYVSAYLPYRDISISTVPDNVFAAIMVTSNAIAHKNLRNLNFNNMPLWIDLRDVTVQSTNNR